MSERIYKLISLSEIINVYETVAMTAGDPFSPNGGQNKKMRHSQMAVDSFLITNLHVDEIMLYLMAHYDSINSKNSNISLVTERRSFSIKSIVVLDDKTAHCELSRSDSKYRKVLTDIGSFSVIEWGDDVKKIIDDFTEKISSELTKKQ